MTISRSVERANLFLTSTNDPVGVQLKNDSVHRHQVGQRGQFVQKKKKAPVLRGIETSFGIVPAGYSAGREAASCSRPKELVRRYAEQIIRGKNFNARAKTPNTWRWHSVDLEKASCSSGDSCSLKHDLNLKGKGNIISRSPSNATRRNSKGDGKGDTQEKDPKVRVRQETQTSLYATSFKRGTHQNAHTTNPKLDAHGGIIVYSSAQDNPVTTQLVKQLLPYNWKKQKN